MVLVAFVEPALVLALQFVVEDNALNVCTAVQETVLGLFVRAIDLEVVLQFSLARQARVERLVMVLIEVSMALEKAAAFLGQADRMIAVPRHARGLDQPLFAQVPQVAGPWISRAAIVVAEITTGDHMNQFPRGRRRSLQWQYGLARAHHRQSGCSPREGLHSRHANSRCRGSCESGRRVVRRGDHQELPLAHTCGHSGGPGVRRRPGPRAGPASSRVASRYAREAR
jgi:hypothetical protein